MSRPEKFTADQLLDAACQAVAEHGRGVTLAQIAARAGAPTGSIYHRFSSRDELLARLWLRSIGRLHEALLHVIDAAAGPHDALVETAVAVVAYSRAHPAEAVSMTLFRQPVLAATGPERVRQAAATVNDDILARLDALTEARYGTADDDRRNLVRIAVIGMTIGLVRPYIGQPIPPVLDQVVRAAVSAVLDLGDNLGPTV